MASSGSWTGDEYAGASRAGAVDYLAVLSD